MNYYRPSIPQMADAVSNYYKRIRVRTPFLNSWRELREIRLRFERLLGNFGPQPLIIPTYFAMTRFNNGRPHKNSERETHNLAGFCTVGSTVSSSGQPDLLEFRCSSFFAPLKQWQWRKLEYSNTFTYLQISYICY